MIFALERRVTKKSKNSIRTKQVPIIRYKNEAQKQGESGARCKTCGGNMLKEKVCYKYAPF